MAHGKGKGKGENCSASDNLTADVKKSNSASASGSGTNPQTGDAQQNSLGLPTPSSSFQIVDRGKAPSTPASSPNKRTDWISSTPTRSSKRLRAAREAEEATLRAESSVERTRLKLIARRQRVTANTDIDEADDGDEDDPSPRPVRKRARTTPRKSKASKSAEVPPATLQIDTVSSQQLAQIAPNPHLQNSEHAQSIASLHPHGNAHIGQLPPVALAQPLTNAQPVGLAPIPGYIQIPGHPIIFNNQIPPAAQPQPPIQPHMLQPQVPVHISSLHVLPNGHALPVGLTQPVGLAPIPGYIQIPGHPLVFNNQLPPNGQTIQPLPPPQQSNPIQSTLSRLDLLQTAVRSPYANIIHRPVPIVARPSPHVLQQVDTCYPPPTQAKPFSLLTAFLKCPPVILRLARHLEPKSLLDLYAISKPFHFIMNSHFTTYIKESALYWAPKSNYIFPWRCYRRLTIKDPGFRTVPGKPEKARDVPGFRWLQMVCYRQRVVEQIIEDMAKHGHICPEEFEETLKKIWFTMDLPRNGNRIGVLHQPGYWLNRDIFLASMFFMKLDMRLSDPVEGTGETQLRGLIFGSRNLLSLRDVLTRSCRTIHILRLQIWYDYRPSPQHRGLQIMGVSADSIGRGHTEGWGRGNNRLLRVDEGVMREGIRRSLQMQTYYLDFVLFGTLRIEEVMEKIRNEKEERARYERERERYEGGQEVLEEKKEMMLMLMPIRGEVEIESY
jgi:hypothetical protein